MAWFDFKEKSLRDKIIWITGISTTFSLVLACLILAVNERLSYPKIMAGNLTDLAQVVGDNSTAALAFNDPKTAQTLLETLKGNPHIVMACLYDSKGQQFASYTSEKNAGTALPPAKSEGYEFSGGNLKLYHDISMNDLKQGTVDRLYARDGASPGAFDRGLLFDIGKASAAGIRSPQKHHWKPWDQCRPGIHQFGPDFNCQPAIGRGGQ
jgi:hypothetical protein